MQNDENVLLFSSDSEEEHEGHPKEQKSVVLEKLFSGFRYHKDGPAQSYQWTEEEIQKMAQHLEEYAKQAKEGKRRKIRAVRYDGTPVVGGLLRFVNDARMGKTFKDNPRISRRQKAYYAGQLTQHQLWHEASEILLAEFDYWSEVHQSNLLHFKAGQPEKCRYPKIGDLIFRHNDDFVGGLWSDFHIHWDRFIDELRYLLILHFHFQSLSIQPRRFRDEAGCS